MALTRVLLVITVTSIASLAQVLAEASMQKRDFCLKETVNLRCDVGSVLLVAKATYGRMTKLSRCITTEFGFGCSADVTENVREMCEGKHNCSFNVGMFLQIIEPCSGDLTSYVSLQYHCEKVLVTEANECGKEHEISAFDGYISFSSARSKSAPTRECPLKMSVSKTQRIKFQLMTFVKRESGCTDHVFFQEGSDSRDINLCSGAGHNGIIYNSNTNKIGLYFHTRNDQNFDFLIKYSVIGCPLLKAPVGGWILQDDSIATVQCNKTKEIWYLTCQGNTWLGDYENCTGDAVYASDGTYDSHASAMFPLGLVMAIVLGIIIGIVAGLILLSAVFFCYKKKAKHEYEQADPPLDYITECQQKQVYASMLRNEQHHKCPSYSDVVQHHGSPAPETEAMLPHCAHLEYFSPVERAPMCPAHSRSALRSPSIGKSFGIKRENSDSSNPMGPLTLLPMDNKQNTTQSYI